MQRFLLIASFFFLDAGTAFADTATGKFQFQPIVALPLTSGGTLSGCTSLGDYLNSAFQLAITAAVILAVIMIVIDGFKYMTAEAAGNKKDALGGIRSALFGLIILLASYMILYIINPNITSNAFNVFGGGANTTCASVTINNVNLNTNGTNTSLLGDTSGINGTQNSFTTSWCAVDPNIVGKICAPSQQACQTACAFQAPKGVNCALACTVQVK